jgi:hypothetical protein
MHEFKMDETFNNTLTDVDIVDGPTIVLTSVPDSVCVLLTVSTAPQAAQQRNSAIVVHYDDVHSFQWHQSSMTLPHGMQRVLRISGSITDDDGGTMVIACDDGALRQLELNSRGVVSEFTDISVDGLTDLTCLIPLYNDLVPNTDRTVPSGYLVGLSSNRLLHFRYGLLHSELQLKAKPRKM